MAIRLLNRQKSIPGSIRFRQPEINWTSPPNASFNTVVMSLIQARLANPAHRAKNNWATDYDRVADEVDAYNAAVCQANGWTQYINQEGGPSLPKSLAPSVMRDLSQSYVAAAAKSKAMLSGAKTLVEFLESGEKPVSKELAESRAAVCVACPLNRQGKLTDWFVQSAAEIIRRQIEKAQALKLTTSVDGKLGLCNACQCPLQLKVHIPVDWITKRLSSEQLAALKTAPACWIISEAKL